MELNKHVKKTKTYLALSLAAGVVMLAAGILFETLGVHLLDNNKAIIGVSFIPLGLALAFGLNLTMAKRNPKGMRSIMAAETDERLAALRHQADSITFRALRWALALLFCGYTFAYPAEVFESAGWWIVFGFFFAAFMLQGVLLAVLMGRGGEAAQERDE